MTRLSSSEPHRTRLVRTADWLAVAVAVSLPWSTSATGILVALWAIALIPVLDWRELRDIVRSPAGGLPVLLVLLGVAGMLWADVTWHERWDGLTSFFKLLAIPLLFIQFRRFGSRALVLGRLCGGVSAFARAVLDILVFSGIGISANP